MKQLLLHFLFLIVLFSANGQLVINEASNSNYTQLVDTEGDFPDWIELYNEGSDLNMSGYHLSDSKNNLYKWAFPEGYLRQQQWILLFASGKSLESESVNHWETVVQENDLWHWINPDSLTATTWMEPNFDASGWAVGKGGFGFEDGDDTTTFAATEIGVYTRISFEIKDTASIQAAVLHMDYDDGFIAYLNGYEIARSNVSGDVQWDTYADEVREALLYQGQAPEAFPLDQGMIRSIWNQGQNVLAVHVMNQSDISTDLSARTFLSFGMSSTTFDYSIPPYWFDRQSDSIKHVSFKLDRKGETIYLSDPNGTIVDSLAIPEKMPINTSYGRSQDGSATLGVFTRATPGTSNNAQTAYTEGFEETPVIDAEPGFYSSKVSVTITGSGTSEIRYTLNGQIPTSVNSFTYSEPFFITTSQVLMARSFSTEGKLPSETVTNSYFIDESPTKAGILSITTDNNNLYGSNGIYDNWWTDWKKPCYIEYFAPETHELVFEQNAGLKIEGGAGGSRSQPQRSFRVEPGKGMLGDGPIKYPLIPSRPEHDEYETFYLRNGSNQYLYYPIKDAIETKCLAEGTNTPYAEYTPVQVYLNGEYWGWYELREKLDAHYFEQNYGIDKDSIELLSVAYWYGGVLRSVDGKNAVENFTNDYNSFLAIPTSSPTFWEEADRYFDLPNYIDYICMQTWIANTDWPYNNIKIFRGPQTDNKWRYAVLDVEWALAPNGWTDSNYDHLRFMANYPSYFPYVHVWQRGLENPKFKAYFINRLADMMNTNWRVERLNEIANSRYNETRPELRNEFKRWGDPNAINEQMATFDEAHYTMLREFANRSSMVRRHMLYYFNLPKQVTITLDVFPAGAGVIKISTIKPTTYPWSGIYFDGVPVTIEAIPNPGYTFQSWDANSLLTSVSDSIFTDELDNSVTFKANFQENGLSGNVTISEINYHSAETMDTDDWVEFWNYSDVNMADVSGWYFKDEEDIHHFTFPANTLLAPNSGLVVANDSVKLRGFYPEVNLIGNFDFKLGNSGDAVRLFDNHDNLIASVTYTDKAPWPTAADGEGKTLELCSPELSTEIAEHWYVDADGGSPGSAFEYECSIRLAISDEQILDGGIYPNPTSGKFRLAENLHPATVSILDVNGKVLEVINFPPQGYEFDLTRYPVGIYLAKITLRDFSTQTFRVVKE